MSLTTQQVELFCLLTYVSSRRYWSSQLKAKDAGKELKGFTHDFLLAFADAEQREANRLQAEAARRQRAADAARKELKRRRKQQHAD